MQNERFVFSFECKGGALLLGRWFEEENTLCSQGSHTGILNGVELNMNKTCVFTRFFAMWAVCFCKNDLTHENAPFFKNSREGLLNTIEFCSLALGCKVGDLLFGSFARE